MPNSIIKTFAKQEKISVAKVEKHWAKAKNIVKKKLKLTEKDDNFYKVVVGVLKKMIGIKESWLDDFDQIWIEISEMERPTPSIVLEIMEMISEGRKSLNWEEKVFQSLRKERTDKVLAAIQKGIKSGKSKEEAIMDEIMKLMISNTKKMTAAEMAKRGGVSKPAVTKAIKNAMGTAFLKAIKHKKGESILKIATEIAKQLGITSAADFVDFKKTLPDWVKKELEKEAKSKKLIRDDLNN